MSLLTQLNLNYLRIFLVVYRTRSMTRAAKELHLTQSGVSQQIKALEEALDITLFDRISRRIIPTSSADTLYKECSRRLTALEKTLSTLSHRGKSLVGEVKVGVATPFGHDLVFSAIKSFAGSHDRVNFDFVNGPMPEILNLLLAGHLDFAITDIPSPDEICSYNTMGYEQLYMVCPQKSLNKGDQGLKRDKFSDMNLISYHYHWDIIDRWFKLNSNEDAHSRFVKAKVADCDTAMKLVTKGLGSALLPLNLAKEVIERSPEKLVMPHKQIPVKLEIGLYVLRDRSLSPAAQFCLNALQKRNITEEPA